MTATIPEFPVSPATRNGLNCRLSYTDGNTTYVFRVRCSGLTYGFELLASESHSRTVRAFYPRRTAPNQFALIIDLIGMDERDKFMAYLQTYLAFALSHSGSVPPQITVTLLSADAQDVTFQRIGVPIRGMSWGTRVGVINYKTQLVFETSGDEPMDQSIGGVSWVDTVSTIASSSPSAIYFYPTGVQLSGDQAPSTGIGSTYQDTLTAAIAGGALSPATIRAQQLAAATAAQQAKSQTATGLNAAQIAKNQQQIGGN